jgi:hypothetical protein
VSIELETISDSGKAPRTRIKDAKSAHAIYISIRNADDASSIDRQKIQSMLDGEPPYSPQQLKSLGQGYRANLNFGESAAALETALSAYSDLVNSVDRLASVKTSEGDPAQRVEWENIIAEEFHRTITDWDEFFYKQQMLAHQFVSQGVGVAYFEDNRSWKWSVCGLKDFKVPRGTPACDTKVEVATIERHYLVGELYQFIENPKIATELGWNVEETRRAILLSTDNGTSSNSRDWERLQEELKNNDLMYSHARSKVVRCIHYFVKEFDGTISHYIATRAGDSDDFLFKKPSRFEHANEAFVLFSYGIGTNGLLHSVRGLGYKLFPFIQLSNRMRNAIVDGAMLSSALMIQPATGEDVSNLSLMYNGPLSILPPGINVVDKSMPNLAGNVLPIVRDLEVVRQNNTGTYNPKQVMPDGDARTATEVQAQLAQQSLLSAQAMNLYYIPFQKLLAEQFRRLATVKYRSDEPGGEEAIEFRKRIEARGVPWKAVEKVYRVQAVRAIGAGSPGARMLAFNEFMAIMPRFDEVGQRNLIRDRVAARVGYDQVDRYIPKGEVERIPIDAKIAELENDAMQGGRGVSVNPGENHAVHAKVHLEDANRFLQALQQNQVDPKVAMSYLQVQYPHSTAHVEQLASDPSRREEVGIAKQILNQMREAVENIGKQLAAQAKREAQARASQQGGQVDPKTQLAIQKAQVDSQIKLQQSQLDQRLKAADVQQKMAIRDAEAAQKIRQKSLA